MKTRLLTIIFGALFMLSFFYSAYGRWPTIDRYAEKYPSVSPYSYVLGNPITNIDINGDSIYVASILAYDRAHGTDYMGIIINDLSAQTGLTYTINSTSMLVYSKDANGNAVIATDNNGNLVGSSTARNLMTSAMDNGSLTANASILTGRGSAAQVGGSDFGVSPQQVNDFIAGSIGVDSRTLGCGMTFMHELYH